MLCPVLTPQGKRDMELVWLREALLQSGISENLQTRRSCKGVCENWPQVFTGTEVRVIKVKSCWKKIQDTFFGTMYFPDCTMVGFREDSLEKRIKAKYM